MASTDIDLTPACWRKSSRSNSSSGDCVEVADGLTGIVPVRDSKRRGGPMIVLSASAWGPFIDGLKAAPAGTAGR